MRLLATIPDAWLIGFGIYSLLFSAGVFVALGLLTQTLRKMASLETRVTSLAEKIVDTRITGVEKQMDGHVKALVESINGLGLRLKDGDGRFERLSDHDQRLELDMVKNIAEIKQHVTERAATKDDLKAHERQVQEHLGRQDAKLNAIESQVQEVKRAV